MIPLLLLAGLGVAAFFVLKRKGVNLGDVKREIWLVTGKRYAILYRTDASLTTDGSDVVQFFASQGFCQVESFAVTATNEVSLVAAWCFQNTYWLVPSNVAIAEL